MFLLAQPEILRLDLLQPLADRHLRVRSSHHRQGVDEQPDQLLDSLQLRRTPRHRGAKGHSRLASLARQQQQPRALHQRVERDFVALGKSFQALGLRRFEVKCVFTVGHRQPIKASRRATGQACGFLQRGQLGFPESFAGDFVLALQPTDVITVTSERRTQRLPGIVLQHLAKQLRTAPAIHQDVMMGVDQMMIGRPGTHQHQIQQWRLFQGKALGALRSGQTIKRGGAILTPLPIVLHHCHVQMLVDHLQWLVQLSLPEEATAQHLVAVHRRLPGALKTRHIQTAHIHAHLIDVVPRTLAVQGLEQQALLHR